MTTMAEATTHSLDVPGAVLIYDPATGFGSLLTPEERGIARRRLTDHGIRRGQLYLEPH